MTSRLAVMGRMAMRGRLTINLGPVTASGVARPGQNVVLAEPEWVQNPDPWTPVHGRRRTRELVDPQKYFPISHTDFIHSRLQRVVCASVYCGWRNTWCRLQLNVVRLLLFHESVVYSELIQLDWRQFFDVFLPTLRCFVFISAHKPTF